MTIPPRPSTFHAEVPPPGFERKLISFWRDRPLITPRLQLVHTNAAPVQSNVDGQFNWANQPGSGHTIPHCQIDRDGRAALILPSNRKGIANYKAAGFSLGFETADTGTRVDPSISAFTAVQAEQVAVACAYYSVLHGIPLTYPATWDGAGTASHTEPFGYPYWTNAVGKTCPGAKKKAQVRNVVLPLAREIVAAWTGGSSPAPNPPPEEDDMFTDADRAKLNAVYATVVGGPAPAPAPGPAPAPAPAPPPPDTSTWNTPEGTPAMRVGSTDASTVIPGVANEGRVSWLQAIHGRWPTTGVYDEQDAAKVREHQTAGGIAVDGVYGEQTEALYKRWRGR